MTLSKAEQNVLDQLAAVDEKFGSDLVVDSGGVLSRWSVYVLLGRMEDRGLIVGRVADAGRRAYRLAPPKATA